MAKSDENKDEFADEIRKWFEEEQRMCNEAKLHFETGWRM